jgi:hypothetical protein
MANAQRVSVTAISGAADPDDLSNSFPVFDCDREAYERKMVLGLRDSDSDEDDEEPR